jgi:hypothetical protein
MAFQFLGVDDAARRRLVLLLFGGDASWRGRAHPHDDPFRSFAYLVSTVWRVSRPRRPGRLYSGTETLPLSRSPMRGLLEAIRP